MKSSIMFVFAIGVLSQNVRADTIVTPGEVVTLDFTTSGSPYIIAGSNGETAVPNGLQAEPGLFGGTLISASTSGVATVTADLYDGNNLLGTFQDYFGSQELNWLFDFVDQDAINVEGIVTGPSDFITGPSDFTSLLNGTSNGHVDISVTGGTLDFVNLSVAGISPEMIWWAFDGPGDGVSGPGWLTLTSVQVTSASPEPSTALLILVPLALFCWYRRRTARA